MDEDKFDQLVYGLLLLLLSCLLFLGYYILQIVYELES